MKRLRLSGLKIVPPSNEVKSSMSTVPSLTKVNLFPFGAMMVVPVRLTSAIFAMICS